MIGSTGEQYSTPVLTWIFWEMMVVLVDPLPLSFVGTQALEPKQVYRQLQGSGSVKVANKSFCQTGEGFQKSRDYDSKQPILMGLFGRHLTTDQPEFGTSLDLGVEHVPSARGTLNINIYQCMHL